MLLIAAKAAPTAASLKFHSRITKDYEAEVAMSRCTLRDRYQIPIYSTLHQRYGVQHPVTGRFSSRTGDGKTLNFSVSAIKLLYVDTPALVIKLLQP